MNRIRALLLVGLVAIVAACSPVASSPSPSVAPAVVATASPAPRAAITVPQALHGTWNADVRNTGATEGGWTLLITDGDLRLQNPHGTDSFSIDPTAVTATELTVAASSDCPDQTVITEGSYAINLQGDSLEFVLNSDSCVDRADVLTANAWTRTP